jgi:WD40 repeat protein
VTAPFSSAQVPRERATLRWHREPVISAAFSPNGKLLASGSYDGTVHLWDVASGTSICRLEDDTTRWRERVEVVLFSPDGKTLAVGRSDATVTLWEVATRRIRAKRDKVDVGWKKALAFSPDGSTLAASGGGRIWYWDLARNRARLVAVSWPYRIDDNLGAFAYAPEGRNLYVNVAFDGPPTPDVTDKEEKDKEARPPPGKIGESCLQLWDAASGNHIAMLKKPWYDRRFAISADARLLAAVRMQDIKLFDLTTRKEAATISPRLWGSTFIRSLTFSPDGKTLALGHSESRTKGSITLLDLATGKPRVTWDAYPNEEGIVELWLAFSPDGRMLASYRYLIGNDDAPHTVKLWDIPPSR